MSKIPVISNAEKIAKGEIVHHDNEEEPLEPEAKHFTETPEEYTERKKRLAREAEYRQMGITADPFANGVQEPEESHDEKVFRELLRQYEDALLTSKALQGAPIEPRAKMLGEWLREGDLGFIYGERGIGKTWLAGAIAVHVSIGTDLDTWNSGGVFPCSMSMVKCRRTAPETGYKGSPRIMRICSFCITNGFFQPPGSQ